MNIITLDFETTFSSKVSLRHLNYSEYIHQTTPFLLAVTQGNHTSVHTINDIPKYLETIDWSDTIVVGHNLLFDAAVLKHHYGIQAAAYRDTLGMARFLYPTADHSLASLSQSILGQPLDKDPLHIIKGKTWNMLTPSEQQTLIQYNQKDAITTARLYETMVNDIPDEEFELMDWTIKLWLNPLLKLNIPLLETIITREQQSKENLIYDLADLRSSKKLYEKLVEQGYNPPTKQDKNGKLIPAFSKTDHAFKAFVKEHNLDTLYKDKLKANSNITSSRATLLKQTALVHQGKLPVAYNYYGAFTGRFSGSNRINLQNFPRGSDLRRAIIAPQGHTLVVGDLAQIEARMLAWLAGETALLEAFRNKEDIYCKTASHIFNKTITPANERERFVGKSAVLGLGYGMGSLKFQDYCALNGVYLDLDFCAKVVDTYRNTYAQIPNTWRHAAMMLPYIASRVKLKDPSSETKQPSHEAMTATTGADGNITHQRPACEHLPYLQLEAGDYHIVLPSGRNLYYRGLYYDPDQYAYNLPTQKGTKKIYGALIIENIIQAICRDLLRDVILTFTQYPITMTTHDELVLCVPTKDREDAAAALHTALCTPPSWAPNLPLDAKVATATAYGDCK